MIPIYFYFYRFYVTETSTPAPGKSGVVFNPSVSSVTDVRTLAGVSGVDELDQGGIDFQADPTDKTFLSGTLEGTHIPDDGER